MYTIFITTTIVQMQVCVVGDDDDNEHLNFGSNETMMQYQDISDSTFNLTQDFSPHSGRVPVC